MNGPLALVGARDDTAHTDGLRRIYAFYIHEVSQFARDEYRLSALGCWEPDHLPYWFAPPFCHPLVMPTT